MRVLIATVTAGAGHLQAAVALEEAWRDAYPGDAVERVDVLDFASKLQRKLYSVGYVKVVERAPELYAHLFRKSDNPAALARLSRARRSLAGRTNAKFVRHARQFRPDVMLCPHFLPLEIAGAMRARDAAFRPFTACVVTDFEAHALWMEPAVDLYCVAAEETKARLVARGVPANGIAVTGIPVARKFAAPVDAPAVRRALGLRDDLPVLLVLSGGFGVGPVAEILAQLDKIAAPFQTVVVAGRNARLRHELAAQDRRHPTHVLGFVRNMHELMGVATLVVTKPGGLTSSEALALGRPLFILNPIPGQEAANSDFLLQHGAAEKANRVEDVPFRIGQLLGSRKLAAMARAARRLGRPDAAASICAEVRRRCEARA